MVRLLNFAGIGEDWYQVELWRPEGESMEALSKFNRYFSEYRSFIIFAVLEFP